MFVYRIGPLLSLKEIKALRCVSRRWQQVVDALLVPALFQSCLDRMTLNPLKDLKVVCVSYISMSEKTHLLIVTIEFTSSQKVSVYRSVGAVQKKEEPSIVQSLDILEKLAPLANQQTVLCAHGLSEQVLKRGRKNTADMLKAQPYVGESLYFDLDRVAELSTDEAGDLIFPEVGKEDVFNDSDVSSEASSPTFKEIKNHSLNVLCMICASFGDLDKAILLAQEGTDDTIESQSAIKSAIGTYAKWHKQGLIKAIEATMTYISVPFEQYLILQSLVFPAFEDDWKNLSEEQISTILTLINSREDNLGLNLLSFYSHVQKHRVELLLRCDHILQQRLGCACLKFLKQGYVA